MHKYSNANAIGKTISGTKKRRCDFFLHALISLHVFLYVLDTKNTWTSSLRTAVPFPQEKEGRERLYTG